MEAAIDTLRQLGAVIEEAHMRPRQAYADVKMAISKSEIAAIHEADLIARLDEYGADFVGRNLAGFLFSGADYVHAQRERRIILSEMQALYQRHDVLLTATSAPAPTLDSLLGVNYAQKWKNPDIYSPFNVTGSPSLVVCNGFSMQGLPLAMQIVGRPFDEAGVFRVGHAYEKAAGWRSRRPELLPGRQAPALTLPQAKSSAAVEVPAEAKAQVDAMIVRVGLTVSDAQRAMLYEVAPTVMATAKRIRGLHGHSRYDEPAGTFRFDDRQAC
jgi:aspartyl-tRNA(Asn)/glutamyl-tRNA(Gln) amidotransferase subunit A